MIGMGRIVQVKVILLQGKDNKEMVMVNIGFGIFIIIMVYYYGK